MSSHRDTPAAALTATLAAAVIIAHQMAAKATALDLFLSSFQSKSLPLLIMAAALFSIVLVLFVSPAMAALGPAKFAPASFGVSGVLHLAEWALAFRFPKTIAVVFYLHVAGLGLVLISGFWSLVSERFDPHTAKKRIAQITRGASFGGLAGGGIAWIVGTTQKAPAMLPVLCAMHLVCVWMMRTLRPRAASNRPAPAEAVGGLRAGVRLMGMHSYLRDLALLVFIGAGGAALINLVFVNRSETGIAPGRWLSFFGLFFTAANIVNCVMQAAVTRMLLEKCGLGVTAAVHPGAITLGSLGTALIPGIGSAAFAKGSEQVIHYSLFRSAYELFYTPLPKTEKRCVKPLVDVGVERVGDIAGAAVGQVLLFLSPKIAQSAMLGAAAGAGLVGLWMARRLDRGYAATLERGLRDRALELKFEDANDYTTRTILMRSMAELSALEPPDAGKRAEAPAAPPDPLLRRIADLRSGDPVRVRRALAEDVLGPGLTAHAISLLGWDKAAEDALQALRRAGPGITGQLVDALLDPETDFAIRRRIPRVLAGLPSARAIEGLMRGLSDRRFEVRYRCGKALVAILERDSGLDLSRDRVVHAVLRELEVDKHLWESHRLLDGCEEDQFVGERANRSLEHVFTLLSMVLPKEPLRISFYALHTEDEMLRGTALEYLDSVLPTPVREQLLPLVEDKRPHGRAMRNHDEALAALLESHQSIQVKLLELRAKKSADASSA